MRSIFTKKGGIVKEKETRVHGAIATYAYIVPDGKKWELYGLYIERDVNATLDVDINLVTGNRYLWRMTQIGAGVTNIFLPVDIAGANERDFWMSHPLLGSGYEITITWGAPQTTPETRLWVLEF